MFTALNKLKLRSVVFSLLLLISFRVANALEPRPLRMMEIKVSQDYIKQLAHDVDSEVPADVALENHSLPILLKIKSPESFVQEVAPSFRGRIKVPSDEKWLNGQEFCLEQNSQDPSHLRRYAAYWLANRMGVIAARVETVELLLNGRSIGVYTLETQASLNTWKVAAGEEPLGISDLSSLRDFQTGPSKEANSMPEQILDVTQACRFLAWESLTVHKNGYLQTGSNALIATFAQKGASLLPKEFGSFLFFPGLSVLQYSKGNLANQILKDSHNRREFLKVLESACESGVEKALISEIDVQAERIREHLHGASELKSFEAERSRLVRNILDRCQEVRSQLERFRTMSDGDLAGLKLPHVELKTSSSHSDDTSSPTFDRQRQQWRQMVQSGGQDNASVPFKVREVKITEIQEGDLKSLGLQQTNYVAVNADCDGKTFKRIGLRLRGHSTRQSFSGKPTFTLKFDLESKEQNLEGNTKLHFKNGLFDGSYLNDYVAAWLFQKSGMPCPKVDFAHVTINGLDYGLYVTVEGNTKGFLKRAYGENPGLLFEGEGGDVDSPMHLDSGVAPKNYKGLVDLGNATHLSLSTGSLKPLEGFLDLRELARFTALEVSIGHYDGYSLGTHNYRIYQESKSGIFHLLPHGMDSLRCYCRDGAIPEMRGILSKALIGSREGREIYFTELERVMDRNLDVEQLLKDTATVASALQKVLQTTEPLQAGRQVKLAEGLLARLIARKECILQEVQGRKMAKVAMAIEPKNNGVSSIK
jgi:hypothetical protein